jgi:hypothetical protein
MDSQNDIVTVENASVVSEQGKWFVKYQTKKRQGQIDVLKIRDVSIAKQRHVWMLVGGLALFLLTPIFITPVLFEAIHDDYLAGGLNTILIITGFGLIACYVWVPSYVSVKHEEGELRIKLRKKGQRKAFVEEIYQKKELANRSQD